MLIPFVDIILMFLDKSSNFLLTSSYLILLKVTFLLKFIKSFIKICPLFTKSAISTLTAKFACFNVTAILCAVNLIHE